MSCAIADWDDKESKDVVGVDITDSKFVIIAPLFNMFANCWFCLTVSMMPFICILLQNMK